MKWFQPILILAFATALGVANLSVTQPQQFRTTADRVASHGYPVEQHNVQTSDGYILTMFRIPYSPKLKNQNVPSKPVAFLMHGLLSSSDCWILNGPANAMAYLFADDGYDVWMGNARGNKYCKKNVDKSPLSPSFWNFSWNEIGLYDLPAMIDHLLNTTGEDALHYVGHSQGTTVFMVLLSLLPRYNAKVKTSHMLAPVGYMGYMRSPLAKILGPLLGKPSLLSELIGSHEFLPSNKLMEMLGSQACKDKSIYQPICSNELFMITGWDSKHFNYTLLPEVLETHPAGSSSSQLIHYIQEFESGYFREFDHGKMNKRYYKQELPPNYSLQNIKPDIPVNFYYSSNDWFSSVVDIIHMARQLANNLRLHYVKYTDWTHLDYLWAVEVKAVINDNVIKLANEYEKKYAK